MFKVLTCLATEHDFRLVIVAALVCFGGSFTAFRLYSRLNSSGGAVRAAWVLLTGLVAGCSVWATHFIAMLAFSTGLKTGFMPMGTLASLAIAVVFMAAAFTSAALVRGVVGKIGGGVLVGLGVGAMHFTGMAAYVTQGQIHWDPSLIVASLVLGVSGGIAAMFAGGHADSLKRQIWGGVVLGLAICSLHFTGMGAVSIVPDASIVVPHQIFSTGVLTVALAMIVSLIILGGLGAVLIEGGANSAAMLRTRRMANAAFEGLVAARDGVISDANSAICALVGLDHAELAARSLDSLFTFDKAPEANGRREGLLHPADGADPIPVEVFSRVLEAGRDGQGDLIVLAVRDLRERRAAEAQIRHLADHDSLTNLANRNAMQSRLAQALNQSKADQEPLAIICVDLDHFKEVNDHHGHLAGDAMLVAVARRLEQSVESPSFVARLGGDEFVVVQTGVSDQPAAAAELAAQLLETLSQPIEYQGQHLHTGASLGVSIYPDDAQDGETLLANADMALYRAKEGGRGAYRFFKREMDENIRERRGLARDLRSAIGAGELILHYQPQARASDGEICGFEALVRWNHPTRGMMPPLTFIPIAEESGLIAPLGEWVLRQACAAAATWEKPLSIAVNLSPIQVHQQDLPTLVHEILINTGLAPARLELEITESALFVDQQRALDVLRRLKALGVRIAMDDFGTGFSSLSTLQSFPFDKIKIDKSFVENIHRHERATAIVRAVLGLGRSLDIPVTAEGVETEEQMDFLRGEACTELQGYAIGRPAPLATADDWSAVIDAVARVA